MTLMQLIINNLVPLTLAIIVILIILVAVISLFAFILRKLGFTKVGPASVEPEEPPKAVNDFYKIEKLIDLRITKSMLPYNYKDESRAIVRDAAVQTLDLLRRITREVVCDTLQGCQELDQGEPTELREYRLISEGAESQMIHEVMKPVDRNHFWQLSPMEWRRKKENIFKLVWGAIESYYEARYVSTRVPVVLLREANMKRADEFLAIFEIMMERCRDISIRTNEEQKAIDAKCASILEELV